LNRNEILAKVRDCIAGILDQPDLKVTMRTTAEDVEGWDSFNHVNIVVAIETEFGISFKAAEVEELRAVGEIVTLIEKKLEAKGG
jgi:acyl carrier protein